MADEVPVKDFTWQQGEDGLVSMIYKLGDPPVEVDLTGYSLRMDVGLPDGSPSLYTFNSNDSDALTVDEAVLGTVGQINITVPRSVSLPGGALEAQMGIALNYDIFLRNAANKQKKILKGTITFEASETLWA